MNSKKELNVFIIGYETFNAKMLQTLPISNEIKFHPLLRFDEIHGSEEIQALDLLNMASKRLEESSVKPDAIVTYWDFPCTIISAILNSRYGLNGPSARSIFKCEHKGWSRSEQKKAIANRIPVAVTFDPNDEAAYEKINLLPPFWIKPVKSFQSWLSFKVSDRNDFEAFREEMRINVDGLYKPFIDLMRECRMADMITNSPESCIAESPLTGHMCTVEGYVYDGEPVIYGVIDSIRERDSNSFQRYQYPSQLPMDVQFRMGEVTRRVIEQVDLNDTCFNIEYFYNQTSDTIHLLEINPRTSQSHADLFEKVHGHSQFQILLEVALNRVPRPMKRDGQFKMACKYLHRVHQAGVVKKVPSEEKIKKITEKYPGTKVELLIKEGDNLDDLLFQDAYSFLIAHIYIGGNDEVEIDEKYREVVKEAGIMIEPLNEKALSTASENTRIEEMASREDS